MFRAGRKLAALKQCGPCALPCRGGSRTAPTTIMVNRGAGPPDRNTSSRAILKVELSIH
jgi:hypothetical protein